MLFEGFDLPTKKRLVVIWKAMDEEDRDHFINEVALLLSVIGSDEHGKKVVEQLVHNMLEDGSKNLADFGLYLEFLDERMIGAKADRFKKASAVLDSYRFKHGLSSEPTKDFSFNGK